MKDMIGLETGEFVAKEARCPHCGSWAVKWTKNLNQGEGGWACFDCPWDETWGESDGETIDVETMSDAESS